MQANLYEIKGPVTDTTDQAFCPGLRQLPEKLRLTAQMMLRSGRTESVDPWTGQSLPPEARNLPLPSICSADVPAPGALRISRMLQAAEARSPAVKLCIVRVWAVSILAISAVRPTKNAVVSRPLGCAKHDSPSGSGRAAVHQTGRNGSGGVSAIPRPVCCRTRWNTFRFTRETPPEF